MKVPDVPLRARLIGLAALVLVLLVGAMFNVLVAVVALIAALALAAPSWFNRHLRWLRPAWYGALLVGIVALCVIAPSSMVGGAVSTCAEIPALRPSGDTSAMVRAKSAVTRQMRQDLDEQPNREGATSEAAYLVSVERERVRYEERVDVHLERGHFVNLDLSELGGLLAPLGPDSEIMVGGDGMVAEMFTPQELKGTIGLSTRPSSVWIETRIVVPRGSAEICRGVTLMPFQAVKLAWPLPQDTPIRGQTQLSASDERLPFAMRIDKTQSQVSAVYLPRNAVFLQRPVLLKRTQVTNGASADRFAPVTAAANVASFAMDIELLPENPIVRSDWAYEWRNALLPPKWTLVLLFVLLVSALGDVFMSHRATVEGRE
ncbi:MAG: hypothetical protein ABW110_04645 [Steroidobacteraceae bacterium]